MEIQVIIIPDAGVLVVSYGSREASIVDALLRSEYKPAVCVADKQANPFNIDAADRTGGKHKVIKGLNVNGIYNFAKEHRDRINFVIPGCEGPIIAGLRDMIEGDFGIPVICPTKEYALEASKVRQRELIHKCCPEANPKYKVFYPQKYGGDKERLRRDVLEWVHDGLGGIENSVIKPDKPGYGKGVGVGGEHFFTDEEVWEHFLGLYSKEVKKDQPEVLEPVIIEENIDGEEFSLQLWSDGKHIVRTPAVRDYKRAFDDGGMNTGGMGSYTGKGNLLPFMTENDWEDACLIGEKIFERHRGPGENTEARGVYYYAFICAADGVKVLEINSRPGDPEWQNLQPIADYDIMDMFQDIVKGTLTSLPFKDKATVVIYAVPMTYGGYREKFSGSMLVNLSRAEALKEKYGDNLRIYPASMKRLPSRRTKALTSRTVCPVGIGDSIEEARIISLEAIHKIDGPLWNRPDIATETHINSSKMHMERLRGKGYQL